MFLPAFVLDYNFGEHFTAEGVRRPEAFQAVIGGLKDSTVAAERHFSPAKVRIYELGLGGRNAQIMQCFCAERLISLSWSVIGGAYFPAVKYS